MCSNNAGILAGASASFEQWIFIITSSKLEVHAWKQKRVVPQGGEASRAQLKIRKDVPLRKVEKKWSALAWTPSFRRTSICFPFSSLAYFTQTTHRHTRNTTSPKKDKVRFEPPSPQKCKNSVRIPRNSIPLRNPSSQRSPTPPEPSAGESENSDGFISKLSR